MRLASFFTLATACTAACLSAVWQTTLALECGSTDTKVIMYRYTGSTCTGNSETKDYYQSGGQIREAVDRYKIYSCCDDMKTVKVTSARGDDITTTLVQDDQCLQNSSIASTGSYGTMNDLSYKFECDPNPQEAYITLTVYPGSNISKCATDVVPIVRMPVYEGCNEDFPYIMNFKCDGENVNIQYSTDNIDECKLLTHEIPTSFTVEPGCNAADPNKPFFGLFTSPIYIDTNCGHLGLSAGATAAVVIIVLILLAGAGFAVWWFVFRKPKAAAGMDFTEYDEYSQLDAGQGDTDLL